jgi:tRNA pseudouridine synthase 10
VEGCKVCRGITSCIELYSSLAAEKLQSWEYRTFLIGTKVEPEVMAAEEEAWRAARRTGEPIKRELNREIGKAVSVLTGREPDFTEPDITVIVDTRYDFAQAEVHSLYIHGRYRKLVRGIPQTRWLCTRCEGRGCEHCEEEGRMYPESVEELIGRQFIDASGAKDFRLHGMGREDIDARMLGNGRPFILELLMPKKRTLDLSEMEKSVNSNAQGKVEVLGLSHAHRADVERIKSSRFDKSYRVEVACEGGTQGIDDAVKALTGMDLQQRTPNRVSQRRADLIRVRRVVDARVLEAGEGKAFIMFRVNAGTYVKELVTGDGGRTLPSLAAALGRRCDVVALDVTEIHDDQNG